MKTVIFLFLMASNSHTDNEFETINGLTYQKPSNTHWKVDIEEYTNVKFVNWATTKYPKKEFSIIVEAAENVDIRHDEQLKAVKKIFPPQTIYSEPQYSQKFGAEALILYFKMSIYNSLVYGKSISVYSSGYEYHIIISRYKTPVDKDQELVNLIESIQIQ